MPEIREIVRENADGTIEAHTEIIRDEVADNVDEPGDSK